ncbi:MAG TPA: LuxR family transcriptional regulator [Slackia equolifaciens]|uniref:LuxR family transcriptional regulator n=1 Tax=Slackia equolifaciens TaxID=498718 RepID=A0A9D2UXC8_9ACTN|nr:LuxR family transcriptional regulator [Slackia equolifaciens]
MDSSTTLRIHARTLLFSLFLLNGMASLLSAGNYLTGTFAAFGAEEEWATMLFAAIVSAAALGAVLIAAREWSSGIDRVFARPFSVATSAAAGLLTAAGLAAASSSSAATATVLLAIAGAAMALSYCVQAIAWSRAFASMNLNGTIAHIGIAAAIASLAALALISSSSPTLLAAAILASPLLSALAAPSGPSGAAGSADAVGAGAPLTHDGQKRSDAALGSASQDSAHAPAPQNAARSKEALKELWPIMGGCMICVSVLFSMWRSASTADALPFASSITQGTFFGFILCSLALGALAAMHADSTRPVARLIWPCPIFAALPLIPCIIPVTPEGLVGFALGACSGIGFAYFITLILASLCHSAGATSTLLFALGVAVLCFAASAALGTMLAMAANSDQITATSMALFVVYLIALGVAPKARASAPANQPVSLAADQAPSPVDPINEQCSRMAKRYSLTPRESEVLEYLAHGRSASYAAKAMFVSTDTVKVHVKHIYEKMGVHSRQDLLDMVQTPDAKE